MMLLPFLCAAILSRQWHWTLLPTAAAILAAFMLREPLVVLGRQKFVWTTPHAESRIAAKWLFGLVAALAVCGALLALRWPLPALLALGTGAAAMTLLAVWMTVRNRQRSWWLQMLSAAGLSASSLAAVLSSTGAIPDWCWWLWALSASHAFAGILVVHARLEARIAAKAKRQVAPRFRLPAAAAQFVMLAGAAWCFAIGQGLLAIALLLSVLVHFWDLATLRTPQALETRLTVVGLRAMTLSILVSSLIVAGLW